MRVLPPAFGLGRWARTYALVFIGLVVVWCLWHGRDGSTRLVDLASDKKAGQVCGQYGWKPFVPSSAGRRRKVYDLCMVNDELDWLEVRLNTTYDEVDYFVVVEAPQTFTGLPKPLTIRDNWARFAPYHAKMLYRELVYPPGFRPQRAWDREDLQRNAMLLQGLAAGDGEGEEEGKPKAKAVLPPEAVPQPGDVLVVADVDEIPRPAALRALRLCAFPRRLTLRSQFYYYSFQFRHRGADWAHPQATTYGGMEGGTILPVNLRNGDSGGGGGAGLSGGSSNGGGGGGLLEALLGALVFPLAPLLRHWEKADMPDAGWHCSSCYATMAELMHKLESVSHVWMNHEYFRDRDRAAYFVRQGRDLFERESEVYDRVDNNTDLPPLLLAQPERFRYLLDRDGESAGFNDYPP